MVHAIVQWFFKSISRLSHFSSFVVFASGASVTLAQPANNPVILISEISPTSSSLHPAWVELLNPTESDVDLHEIALRTVDAWAPSIFSTKEKLGHNQIVVICFAQGLPKKVRDQCPKAESVHFGDPSIVFSWRSTKGQLSVLHIPGGRTSAARLIDFVAWGGPPTKPAHEYGQPIVKGPRQAWVTLSETTGSYDPNTRLQSGQTIGRLPRSRKDIGQHWTVYDYDETSPGEKNTRPTPRRFFPPSGTTVRLRDASVAWVPLPDDQGYRFQICSNGKFKDQDTREVLIKSGEIPLVRLGNLGLKSGKHYYRVQRLHETGSTGWSDTQNIKLANINILRGHVKEVPGIKYAYQRKDTGMVCLTECAYPENTLFGCGCDASHWDRWHLPDTQQIELQQTSEQSGIDPLTPPEPWDCSHLVQEKLIRTPSNWSFHGTNNCVRASISMVATAYGSCLSQDRIAYQERLIIEASNTVATEPDAVGNQPPPEGGLLHAEPTSYCESRSGGYCSYLLSWLFSYPPMLPEYAPIFRPHRVFEFAKLEHAISAGQPIMSLWSESDHMRVIDATRRSFFGGRWIRVLDPMLGAPQWEKYDRNAWRDNSEYAWILPSINTTTRKVVQDEDSVWLDSDKDGLVDFDEKWRFKTDKCNSDSDGDGLSDFEEITEYAFREQPCENSTLVSCTPADFDGDGDRKEVDTDNDGDSCVDGWEDTSPTNSSFDPTDCTVVLIEPPILHPWAHPLIEPRY